MSKPRGAVGAWALDAERAEAEELELAATQSADVQSFPSLKEAASTKPKKKKGITLSLSQFAASSTTSLTQDGLRGLPTGPKERSPDELEHARGFRGFSGPRGFPDRRSDDDGDSRRGGPPRASEFDGPSRADEADNWAVGKKSFTETGRSDRDRYSSLGSGDGDGSSRADELDNWSIGKKPLPSRFPSSGSGFRDSNAFSDSDRFGGGGGGQLSRDRPRLVLDPPKKDAHAVAVVVSEPGRTRPSPFGAARPREEILKEKGLDPIKIDSEIEAKKTSRPTSSHSSRPSSAQSSRPGSPVSQVASVVTEGAPKARVKVNPFGDAKPREVRLQEQGIDWRKLDLELEHRSVNRPETEEENLLKEEINHLKAQLTEIEENLNTGSAKFAAEDSASLKEQILHKETELEVLMRQLDDKMRFSQRSSGDVRPGSGAGRLGISSDRPPSQSGRSEDSRSGEFMDRPRSRGSVGDGWGKPMDDRRGFFQGGRERGFLSERNTERSKPSAGW